MPRGCGEAGGRAAPARAERPLAAGRTQGSYRAASRPCAPWEPAGPPEAARLPLSPHSLSTAPWPPRAPTPGVVPPPGRSTAGSRSLLTKNRGRDSRRGQGAAGSRSTALPERPQPRTPPAAPCPQRGSGLPGRGGRAPGCRGWRAALGLTSSAAGHEPGSASPSRRCRWQQSTWTGQGSSQPRSCARWQRQPPAPGPWGQSGG